MCCKFICSRVAMFCASKLVWTAWLRISPDCTEKFPSRRIIRIGMTVAAAKTITRRRNMGMLLKDLNIVLLKPFYNWTTLFGPSPRSDHPLRWSWSNPSGVPPTTARDGRYAKNEEQLYFHGDKGYWSF